MRSYYWGGSFDAFLATTAIGLAILILIAVAWLAIKCLECVVRAFAHHPTCKPLLVVGAIALATVVLAALMGGQSASLDGLAILSILALVLVAKIVNLYYDSLFQTEVTREHLVSQIVHEPWWNAA